jgi:hypothetical protein
MTTGSAHHLHWTPVASIPSAAADGFSMSRRILYRALAVVVALAAFAPLFVGADLNGPATGEGRKVQAQVAGLPPMLQAGRVAEFGVARPTSPRFQHH